MQINENAGAVRLKTEISQIANDMKAVDNIDSVDLSSTNGKVVLENVDLTKINGRECERWASIFDPLDPFESDPLQVEADPVYLAERCATGKADFDYYSQELKKLNLKGMQVMCEFEIREDYKGNICDFYSIREKKDGKTYVREMTSQGNELIDFKEFLIR